METPFESRKIDIRFLPSPFGELILGSFEGRLCLCDWRYRKMRDTIDKRIRHGLEAEYNEADSPLLQQAVDELGDYFAGERKEFSLPLLYVGTPFQQSVWEALREIPYGATESYRGLAIKLKTEKAVRAVAAANGANALAIFVPCHRIIGSNGELVGYAGGIRTKQKLLELETGTGGRRQMELF